MTDNSVKFSTVFTSLWHLISEHPFMPDALLIQLEI